MRVPFISLLGIITYNKNNMNHLSNHINYLFKQVISKMKFMKISSIFYLKSSKLPISSRNMAKPIKYVIKYCRSYRKIVL